VSDAPSLVALATMHHRVNELARIVALTLIAVLTACPSNPCDAGAARSPATQPGSQPSVRRADTVPPVRQANASFQGPKDYRVQLGVFRQRQEAEEARSTLLTQLAGELEQITVIPLEDADNVFRVTSEPMTAARAEAVCAKLLAEHRACEVVKK